MPARKPSSMAAAATAKTTPASPSAMPAPTDDARDERVKFTALLDGDTSERFDRIVGELRRFGRRGGRYAGKADVLRALVRMVDDDPDLADRMTGYLFPTA